MVEYLIDLNDNEKEYTPITITQAIMNIYRRGEQWKNQLFLTVGDCWWFLFKKTKLVEIEEDITKLTIENEEVIKILTLAEAKLAYIIRF